MFKIIGDGTQIWSLAELVLPSGMATSIAAEHDFMTKQKDHYELQIVIFNFSPHYQYITRITVCGAELGDWRGRACSWRVLSDGLSTARRSAFLDLHESNV